MTRLVKKNESTNMHLHKAFEIINKYLPNYYVKKVQEKIGDEYSSGTIRNVRNLVNESSKKRINIINALVEVALDNKKENLKQLKKLEKLT